MLKRKNILVLSLGLGSVLVSIPLLSIAGNVTIPNTFSNGAVADATQVNSNFSALETAVDDNDSRLTVLEGSLTITSDGKVGINHLTPASTFQIKSVDTDYAIRIDANGTGIMSFEHGGAQSGYIVRNSAGTTTTFGTTSDVRLKDNIADTVMGLETLQKVRVRDFNFKADPADRMQGVIAQELHDVYPHAVHVPADPDDTWAVDHGRLTPLIIKAVQELHDGVTIGLEEQEALHEEQVALQQEVNNELRRQLNEQNELIRRLEARLDPLQ